MSELAICAVAFSRGNFVGNRGSVAAGAPPYTPTRKNQQFETEETAKRPPHGGEKDQSSSESGQCNSMLEVCERVEVERYTRAPSQGVPRYSLRTVAGYADGANKGSLRDAGSPRAWQQHGYNSGAWAAPVSQIRHRRAHTLAAEVLMRQALGRPAPPMR